MVRAAVLIGVAKAGKPRELETLEDAVGGALRIRDWALANGFAEEYIRVLINPPVRIAEIQEAILALVDSGTVEQLLVYFAGHGVNIGYSEYWLLSGAPMDSGAAVNVAASVECARKCGIPHVVFISDACRTPAATIRSQGIQGGVIFPNDPVMGPEQDIDIFFAATLGQPALELQDPRMAGAPYRAIYTDAFLDGLTGKLAAALRAEDERMLVVRPRPLKDCLFAEIPRRFDAMGFTGTIPPCPDARITSGDQAWLARFPGSLPSPPPTYRSHSGAHRAAHPLEQANLVVQGLLRQLGDRATGDYSGRRSPDKRWEPPTTGSGADDLLRRIGPSAIVVPGRHLLRCLARGAQVHTSADAVSLTLQAEVADALLVFDDGSSAVLPVMRGRDLRVTLERGQLVDLMYPPAGDASATPLRLLHNTVATAARTGRFTLEGQNGQRLLQLLENARDVEPALLLYAAYAFQRLHAREPIRRLHLLMMERCGFDAFDLALLDLYDGPAGQLHPLFPLMAQGWALLAARATRVPDALAGLQRHLLPSLWSHFNKDGTVLLQSTFQQGD
jgi:hypothetical protein